MFNCHKVRVFNSPNNMFFVARYMACAMASSPYCYFQDDDWKIHYLRSMYANFLRHPQFLHTDTNSDVWALTNWRWCFFEDGKHEKGKKNTIYPVVAGSVFHPAKSDHRQV